MISGKTIVCCVIGNPVSHSLTPLMQNAAFASAGLDFVFVAFSPTDLKSALLGMKSMAVRAVAVTLPFKKSILEFVDILDESVQNIGAANALILENGSFKAYNFDGIAAVKALNDNTSLDGKTIGILGAGGAARSIAYELSRKHTRVLIFNRSVESAKKLVEDFHLTGFHGIGHTELISQCEILINTTSVGMTGFHQKKLVDANIIHKDQTVFDIVYTPKNTEFLKDAKKNGAKIIYGYKMLLYGGVFLFEKLTGIKAPVAIMERELLKQLHSL